MYCLAITALISSVDDTRIGPRPGVEKYAGKQISAAKATGTYGSHIDARDGACETTASVSRARRLISAAMPKSQKPYRPTDIDDVSAVVGIVGGEIDERAVRQRHHDDAGAEHRQRRAPPATGPCEDKDCNGQDRDVGDRVGQRKSQSEGACAARVIDTPHHQHPGNLEQRARHDEPVEHEANPRMARISDGEQHHRQACADGEQQIAGIGERRERSLMQHTLVEHPERLAAAQPESPTVRQIQARRWRPSAEAAASALHPAAKTANTNRP